ncbi:MAG: cysteine desulfurase-like protein, partial [Lentimicrobiaceae bacterium]|nr:cysteine desulfurase-like protein [Lentimicrobiaceae bacterium]
MNPLLIHKIRGCFPSLDNTWAYFDNAGGSQVPKHVGDNIIEYLYETNVQHGASYEISELARHRIINARSRWSEAI